MPNPKQNENLKGTGSSGQVPTSSGTGDTSATATEVHDNNYGDNNNNDNSGAREEDFDYEMQDYHSKKSDKKPSRPRSNTNQTRNNGSEQVRQFPMQEVIPNTHMAVATGSNPAASRAGNFRNGMRSRLQKVNSNIRDIDSAQPGGPPPSRGSADFSGNYSDGAAENDEEGGENGDNKMDQHAFNAPLMVRPKTLYQNPQTPTVLPSTYHPINKWTIIKDSYLKEFLGEFLGTMVMIIFGNGVNCQVVTAAQLQQNSFERAIRNLANTSGQLRDVAESLPLLISSSSGGTFDEIAAGWAAGTTMGYFSAGGSAVSGAHLNPSITVANFIYRGFPLKKVPEYIVGQVLGAFAGALILYIYYKKVLEEAYPGEWWKNESVASIFCAYPKPYLSTSRQFVSEFISTALLQIGTFALTDPYTCLSSNLFPLMFFILLYIIMASLSYQTGSAMNMARDLGPRLALYAIGFNRHILWIKYHHFFWIPMVAPFIGSITGGLIYDICIYQGHESPVNWPISTYKDIFRTIWFKRTLWSRHNRWPAEDEHKNEDTFSDFDDVSQSYSGDEDKNEFRNSGGKADAYRSPSLQEDGLDQNQMTPEEVHFKSIKGKDGRYHSGIPAISEENPSVGGESLDPMSISIDDTDISNETGGNQPSIQTPRKKGD